MRFDQSESNIPYSTVDYDFGTDSKIQCFMPGPMNILHQLESETEQDTTSKLEFKIEWPN
jgi:hypothetical protein